MVHLLAWFVVITVVVQPLLVDDVYFCFLLDIMNVLRVL